MPIDHAVVSAEEWEQARLCLLEKEKELGFPMAPLLHRDNYGSIGAG